MSTGEKKHHPTQQKLLKARKEGQVIKSQTLSQLFQLVGVLVGIGGAIRLFWSSSQILLQYQEVWDLTGIIRWGHHWISILALTVGVVVTSGGIASLIGEIVQVGLQVHLKPIHPDFKRINPFLGGKRIFTGLRDSWLICMKFLAGIGMASIVIAWYFHRTAYWATASDLFVLSQLQEVFFRFGTLVVVCFFGIAVIERLHRKHQFLREQRMTDQELKEELKDAEGDPHIRSEQRAQRQQLLFSELPPRVRKAKVVIVDAR